MVFNFFRRKADSAEPNGIMPQDAPFTPSQSRAGANALEPIAVAPRLEPLGPILWQGARQGMTHGEVKQLNHGIIDNPDPGKLNKGAQSDLIFHNLDLAGHSYNVLFYFKDNALLQVTIASSGNPKLDDFRNITNALRLKYGAEVSYSEKMDTFSTAEWLTLDGINISIACLPSINCLNVNFQNRYSDAARML